MMTYEDFEILVRSSFPNDGDIRYGQHWFNTLYSVKPEIADRIRGTLHDPFHREKVSEQAQGVARTLWNDIHAHDKVSD